MQHRSFSARWLLDIYCFNMHSKTGGCQLNLHPWNQQKKVCPRSRGKRAALLRLLATPTPRAKPARVTRPTRLQFQEFIKQQPLSGAMKISNSKKSPIGYNGAPHICPQDYPFPLTDPQTTVPASCMDPSKLPSQMASGSDPPFFHSALDRQTHTETHRQMVTGKV